MVKAKLTSLTIAAFNCSSAALKDMGAWGNVIAMQVEPLVVKEFIALPIRPDCVRHVRPSAASGGVIVACPHSGRFYPPELAASSVLDPLTLRRSEDAFVDLLFQDAPARGALLLVNEFARAFVDVNREPDELDPKLIFDIASAGPNALSERVRAGLGVIPRTVGDGLSIHNRSLSLHEVQLRLAEVHEPWHTAIEHSLSQVQEINGSVILLDCHSMPNHAAGDPRSDIVLGDRFGASCAPIIMAQAAAFLKDQGLKVARNNPYAGGYTTRRHGHPSYHHHALQIEINRSLYMVEGALTLRPQFNDVRRIMSDLILMLANISKALRQ
jgi:N-formylglutamate amidohydrolase